MKYLKWIGIVAVVFFAAAIAIGHFYGKSGKYSLTVMNAANLPAKISISMYDKILEVTPGSIKTFEIDGQDINKATAERVFTIDLGGAKDEIKANIGYLGTTLVDVTGDNCFVAADYGPQYRPKGAELPAGKSDIVLEEILTGKKVYKVKPSIDTALGKALPDNIKITSGAVPKHVRLTDVPCKLINNSVALYQYLNTK